MNLSLVYALTALKLPVYLAAMIPFLIALIMWLGFYIRFDLGRLKKISDSFRKLADEGEKFKDCNRENISFMDEMVVRMAPPYFLEAWLRMQLQLESSYKGKFIPEAQSFYNFDVLVTDPGCRGRLDFLWRSFWILGLVSISFPFGVAYFIQPGMSGLAAALGLCFFLLICFTFLLFSTLDQKIYFTVKSQYGRFVSNFNRILPVAKAEVALLLEATWRNQEVYEEATQKIVERFDRIVDDALLPALEDSIETIMRSNLIPAILNIEKTLDENMSKTLELQEKGMDRMTSSFANRLADTVQGKMNALAMTMTKVSETLDQQMAAFAMTISDVRGQVDQMSFGLGNHVTDLMEATKDMAKIQREEMAAMTDAFTESLTATLSTNVTGLNHKMGQLYGQMDNLNTTLFENIEALSTLMTDQGRVLEESAKILTDSEALQKGTIEEAAALQLKAVENSEILNTRVQSLAELIDRMAEQNTIFSRDAFQFTKETNEAQLRMSEGVQLSQAKLEAAVNETMSQYAKMNSMISDMMDNITGRMNEAMINAGKEIAFGIKEVTADNAEAISNLTEQAQNLRGDYESYFARTEESSARLIEEMDYQVKTIISRMSEDIGGMMKENTEANGAILERYKDNTTELLQSFDEQARSIGLYAREINMDITELSGSLRGSVAEFSDKMQEGVRHTLGEFDQGLSELAKRMANTVESISDAVEALPEALGKK